MNETLSLLLATSVLALGGLGLYMYKSNDDKKGGNGYDENKIFGNDNEENISDEDYDYDNDYDYDYEPKPRTRNGGKTKRSRKGTGTKRRY